MCRALCCARNLPAAARPAFAEGAKARSSHSAAAVAHSVESGAAGCEGRLAETRRTNEAKTRALSLRANSTRGSQAFATSTRRKEDAVEFAANNAYSLAPTARVASCTSLSTRTDRCSKCKRRRAHAADSVES